MELPPLFKRKIRNTVSNSSSQQNEHEKPWFSPECAEKRDLFYRQLNKFRNNKTDENRMVLNKTRSDYKLCIRKQKLHYDRAQTRKLEQSRFKNAKMNWIMLKQSAGIHQSNISLSTFEQYFKSVNNPNSLFFYT